jgi:tripartite-type tricarboxylate transporter receptor subunit TctC
MKNKKWILLITAAVLVTAAAAAVYLRDTLFADTPRQLNVTVAWNPHSLADDMVRAMAPGMEVPITLLNMPGALGSAGANAVYRAAHDGSSVLSTSLSAFVTGEALGFAEQSHTEWEMWLCAFSPAWVVVPDGSPYADMYDLIADLRARPGQLRCADSGFGTVSFAAAELLSVNLLLEFEQLSYPGSNPAIAALLEGEAQFGVLLSAEAFRRIQPGELRVLATFGEAGDVPGVRGLGDRLDAVLPFGEYYGLFIPAGVPDRMLNGLDAVVGSAAETEGFGTFLRERGLERVNTRRDRGMEITGRYASVICWILFDAGYLPTNPETIGIRRIQT